MATIDSRPVAAEEPISDAPPTGARPPPGAGAVALGVATCLNLAAAPVFALMAVAVGLTGHDQPGAHAAPVASMPLMYGLMSLFHAGAWLRLVARRWI